MLFQSTETLCSTCLQAINFFSAGISSDESLKKDGLRVFQSVAEQFPFRMSK